MYVVLNVMVLGYFVRVSCKFFFLIFVRVNGR